MRKLLLFLMTILLFTGCNSDDNSLPDETQEGKGTFGCTVNGNAFKGRSFSTHPTAGYPGKKRFDLYRDDYIDSLQSDFSISIVINHPIEEGKTYLLSVKPDTLFEGDYGSISYSIKSDTPDEWWGKKYYTTAEHTGELTITKLDTEKQIASGTFWFDVKNPYTGERVKVREGRFDTHFSQ